MIYLDNASTTKCYKEVLDIFEKYEQNNYFNPATIYKSGKDNSILLEKIKLSINSILGINNKQIVFTSSATEANNLAIQGFLNGKEFKGYNIITTKIEHKSVLNVFKHYENKGFEVRYLDVNKEQKIDTDQLKTLIDERTIFISIMSVNNETGSILNLKDVYEIIKSKNIVLHSDFSQSIFKTKDFYGNYCNMITISSHKIHGLKSIAALIYDKNINLSPIIIGGGQEYGVRSSTVDIPLIASFYKAIEINSKKYKQDYIYVKSLHDHLVQRINKTDYLELNSIDNDTFSPFIVNFSFKNNIKASVVVEELSNKEIYVSSTSACNSKKEEASYVIYEIFKDEARAKNTIRISFDCSNTFEDIDKCMDSIDEIVGKRLWSY